MNIKSTKVFKINGILFVADSIEDAIRIFREKFSFTIDIEHIVLITGDNSNLAWTEDTSALFDSAPTLCAPLPTFEDAPPASPTSDDAPLTPLTEEEINDLNNYLNEPGI